MRGHDDQHIRLNPGLDHIMHADDTVYYIGFTREEYSKVGGASHIHTAVWEVKWAGPHTHCTMGGKVGGASHIHTALWEVKWVGPHMHYGK